MRCRLKVNYWKWKDVREYIHVSYTFVLWRVEEWSFSFWKIETCRLERVLLFWRRKKKTKKKEVYGFRNRCHICLIMEIATEKDNKREQRVWSMIALCEEWRRQRKCFGSEDERWGKRWIYLLVGRSVGVSKYFVKICAKLWISLFWKS